MSQDINIKLDKNAIKGIEQKAYKCLGLTARVLQDDIREAMVVPRDTGNLQNEGFFVDNSTEKKGFVRLQFTPPYSRRLYFHPEYKFNRDKNPNAQGMWLRAWQKGGKHEKRAQEVFSELLKKEL